MKPKWCKNCKRRFKNGYDTGRAYAYHYEKRKLEQEYAQKLEKDRIGIFTSGVVAVSILIILFIIGTGLMIGLNINNLGEGMIVCR